MRKTPSSTPGKPPTQSISSTRRLTCLRSKYIGATISLITAAKISAVPTLSAGEMAKKRIRMGAVIDPAPTPVSPTAMAMTKPTRYGIRSILDRVYRDLTPDVKTARADRVLRQDLLAI